MKKFLAVSVLALVVVIAACTASQIQQAEQLAGILLQDVPQLVVLFGGAHLATVILPVAAASAYAYLKSSPLDTATLKACKNTKLDSQEGATK